MVQHATKHAAWQVSAKFHGIDLPENSILLFYNAKLTWAIKFVEVNTRILIHVIFFSLCESLAV